MCTPLAAAGFGLSAIGQVAGFMGQQGQTDAYNAAAEQNAINASVAATRAYEDEGKRYIYDTKAANQQAYQTEMQAREARGTAIASAGSAGLDASSISVNSILNNIDEEEANNLSVLKDKQDDLGDTYRSQTASEEAQAQGRINAMPFKSGPSPLSLGLGIATSGLDSITATKQGKSWLGFDQG